MHDPLILYQSEFDNQERQLEVPGRIGIVLHRA